MWRLANYTPYKADTTWGRDKDGVHEWIVAVKGVFDINADGTLSNSDEQMNPLLTPVFNGEEGRSSLRYDADLVSTKPTTDVIINGTAYAPNERPTTEFFVHARIGEIQKSIRVIGNRIWEDSFIGPGPSRTEPVTEVPIRYERAYGGYDAVNPNPANQRMDARNPVGCGVAAESKHLAGKPLHNFEYPSGSIEKAGPAGFGAIASYWSPRQELNGTYDDKWQRTRRPLLALDWDARSLLCSPPDQRPASYLLGAEPVELINMTRNGILRFNLPTGYFICKTRINSRRQEHRTRLSTIIIEPDFPRVIAVWTSTLKVAANVDYLDETVVREEQYL